MKKIFFFASAMLIAVSMSAETVWDWENEVGKLELTGSTAIETVKSQANKVDTKCITFSNGYSVAQDGNPATNYAELTLEGAGFQVGDVVVIDYFFNNSDNSKVATVGIYNTKDEELAASPKGLNGKTTTGFSTFQYTLVEDMDTIRVARAKTGKTKTCVARLEVVRGGIVVVKAGTPVFSKVAGEYFDPFKVGISATPAEKIFVSLNNGTYEEYTDSIAISQYDVNYVVSAFATYEGAENSDTVSATYKLKHFVPRPIFQARKTIDLSGITAEDIQILSEGNSILSTRSMDGETCPTIAYKHIASATTTDSLLLVTFTGREDVLMRYKNGSDKSPAMTIHSKYFQSDSKNLEIYVSGVQSGDTIVFVVTAKGSAPEFSHTFSSACYLDPYQPDDDEDPCYTDGAVFTTSDARTDNDYCGWTNLVYIVQEGEEGGHTKIRLKETANGCRIAKIQIGASRAAGTGVEDLFMNQKAIKRIVDGQIVIEKGNRRFNVLGTEIK